jgi:PAS domain S-box-containing protein
VSDLDREAFAKLLQQSLEGSEFPWWEWDIVENRVTFNDRKVTMLGYDAARFRDVGYEAFTDLLHPEDYERAMQAMRDHLAGAAPLYQVDYRIRRADGTYTWYMDRGDTMERDAEGWPLRLRGLVIDLGPEMERRSGSEVLVALIRQSLPGPDGGDVTTVCSSCTRMQIEDEWISIGEAFHRAYSHALSHGICPDCMQRLYPEYADDIQAELKDAA